MASEYSEYSSRADEESGELPSANPVPEPYVRLATLRALHTVVANLNVARSLPDTLQAVVDGVVEGSDFSLAACNLVRPEGDLKVEAVGGSDEVRNQLLGSIAPRTAWDDLLEASEPIGELRFLPYERGGRQHYEAIPHWVGPTLEVSDHPRAWHPNDFLLAPMYSHAKNGQTKNLLGVLSMDRPRSGRRPGVWEREALEMFALHASIAISNAQLRSDMHRALGRMDRDQRALRANEESFRQAFEFAPSGMAMTELYPGQRIGKLLRANDALCRMLGRTAAALKWFGFADLVHPHDLDELLTTPPGGGRAEVRLARRDGHYLWVCLRMSPLSDGETDGPQFLLTHVEDIDDRKRHEQSLAHRASHDSLTGLPNGAELRERLNRKLCTVGPVFGSILDGPEGDISGNVVEPVGVPGGPGGPGESVSPWFSGAPSPHQHAHDRAVAVLFCDLDGFKPINDRYGHHIGDAVLVEVARRLQQEIRGGDTVARLGGDEFVVLADDIAKDEADDLAARLKEAIEPPVQSNGQSVRVGASFGIGWASCGMTAEEVLRSADQKMYREKRGRSRGHRRAG